MAVYFVTGKLGSGKTLAAVGRIHDYLVKGRKVATNLDLNLTKLLPVREKKSVVYRVPDKPTVEDLEALGIGNDSYDENKNGLLVLDECGTWFNARSWNDKKRAPVIDWFLHARKLGWDIIFIVQDISLVDKQAREALAEHVVYCKRTDRLSIPLVGGLLRKIGIKFPKVHYGIVKYGDSEHSLTVDRWVYRGKNFYQAYDTKQIFVDDPSSSVYQYLPNWYFKGRYLSPSPLEQVKRKLENKSKIDPLLPIKAVAVGFISALVFSAGAVFATYASLQSELAEVRQVVVSVDPVIQDQREIAEQSNESEENGSEPVSPALQRFRKMNLGLSGIFQAGENTEAIFMDSSGRHIRSSALFLQGITMAVLSRCHVILRLDGEEKEIFCGAPAAVPGGKESQPNAGGFFSRLAGS